MKRNLRLSLAVLLALLLAAAPVFAGGSSETGAPEPVSNEITIFARTGPDSSEWLRTVAEAFTKETGMVVNFIEQGQAGYFTNLTNQLVGGTDTFDLAVTNSTYVGPWAYAGYISPLDDYMAKFADDYDWEDLAFSYKIEGKTYAIPYSISSHLLFYRSDLISKDELPTTWDEYVELAKKNTQAYNPDAGCKYGTSWTAIAGPQPPKCFYDFLWSLGGDIQKDGKATLNSEAGIKAAKYIEELVNLKVVPPEVANYGYPDSLDALLTGTCAMACPYWSAAYSDIKKSNSPYKDVLKVAMVPGGVSFNHSYTLVLNNKAKNPAGAMKYYEFLTNKAMQLAYAQDNGVSARFSALNNPDLDREFYDVLAVALANQKSEPLVPYYLEQHDIMNKYLSAIMTKTMDAETAMNAANKELDALYAQY